MTSRIKLAVCYLLMVAAGAFALYAGMRAILEHVDPVPLNYRAYQGAEPRRD
jgi:hypothetical protein